MREDLSDSDDSDDDVSYTSKGPIHQRRVLGSHQSRVNPYLNNVGHAANHVSSGSSMVPPQAAASESTVTLPPRQPQIPINELGQIIDDPTSLSVDPSSFLPGSPLTGNTGIPALPEALQSEVKDVDRSHTLTICIKTISQKDNHSFCLLLGVIKTTFAYTSFSRIFISKGLRPFSSIRSYCIR